MGLIISHQNRRLIRFHIIIYTIQNKYDCLILRRYTARKLGLVRSFWGKGVMGRVQDYLDSETRYRNDVIVSLRFG